MHYYGWRGESGGVHDDDVEPLILKPDRSVLDEALERLAPTAPEFGSGLSNHGPMAAEALVQLGCSEAVLPWSEEYMRQLEPAPRLGNRISSSAWIEARGVIRRYPDWQATFMALAQEQPWQELVSLWVPRLLPGAIAAATHCLIRTAHAVRALRQSDTEARREELATALAYWASSYVELPGVPLLRGHRAIAEAAAALPLIPQAERRGGLITDQALCADVAPGWQEALSSVEPPVDIGASLTALTGAFARWYVSYADTEPIAFVHGVTAPAAVRILLPYLPRESQALGFAYAWQACASLRVALGVEGRVMDPGPPVSAGDLDIREVVEQAVDGGDEHAIKMTEACLREYELSPDPWYLTAAKDVAGRLHR